MSFTTMTLGGMSPMVGTAIMPVNLHSQFPFMNPTYMSQETPEKDRT